MTEQEQYDKIEQYLNRSMSVEEQRAFERELKKNNHVKVALAQQQSEHRAMEVLVAQDLRDRMAQWERKRTGFGRRTNYLITTFVILVFIAFAVFSIVAGNGVFALHYRRVGKPVLKSILNPASFPILNFNRLEWILLVSSLAISMAIGIAAARSG